MNPYLLPARKILGGAFVVAALGAFATAGVSAPPPPGGSPERPIVSSELTGCVVVNTSGDIESTDPYGRSRHILARPIRPDSISGLTLSADSSRVAYVQRRYVSPNRVSLMFMGIDGRGKTRIPVPDRLLADKPQAAISRDGKRVVFSTAGPWARPVPQTWVVDLDGRNLQYLGVGSNPAWSPRGDEVAVTRHIDRPRRIAVFTLRADRTSVGERVSNPPAGFAHLAPQYDPLRRRRFVVIEQPMMLEQPPRWLAMVGDGRGGRRITGNLVEVSRVRFSPSGQHLIFSIPVHTEFRVLRRDGGGLRRVTFPNNGRQYHTSGPVWGPPHKRCGLSRPEIRPIAGPIVPVRPAPTPSRVFRRSGPGL